MTPLGCHKGLYEKEEEQVCMMVVLVVGALALGDGGGDGGDDGGGDGGGDGDQIG